MTKEEFGAHLRSLLESRGFSQKDLSRLTGIRESTISDWINGKYYPKQDKRLLIAKALKISTTRLFALAEDEPPAEGDYRKDKYKELKELFTSIVDRMDDDGIALSKGDANILLDLLRLEIMYRYRM
jgi:bifunctional S24 family peptidase/transcriptional regulator|nr:MAG TPA: Repressor protein CI [Caudoviricetes sp.]